MLMRWNKGNEFQFDEDKLLIIVKFDESSVLNYRYMKIKDINADGVKSMDFYTQ